MKPKTLLAKHRQSIKGSNVGQFRFLTKSQKKKKNPKNNIHVKRGSPRVIMVKMLACGPAVSEFELQSCITFTFGLIPMRERYELTYCPSYW